MGERERRLERRRERGIEGGKKGGRWTALDEIQRERDKGG